MRFKKFMKKKNFVFLLVLLLSVAACSFTTKNKIDPGDNDKEKVMAELVTFVLENYHYSPKEMDVDFSVDVYSKYLKSLDPRKRFFLQSDIDEFEKYEEVLGEQLKNHNIDFFELTYSRIQQRMEEMEEVYKGLLDKPLDFNKPEEINMDYDNLDYPANKEERLEAWRKQLKFSVLSTYFDNKKEEKLKREKIAEMEENGEDISESFDDPEPKSDEKLEEDARESIRHTLDQFYDINKDLKKEDWFAVYMNIVANQFDPHTGYYAPPDKERFDIAMSGSLEGIGAQLQKDIDNIKVTAIISGGPAWTDGELKVGDIIQKVKQEDEEESVSISGMSINDAVKLIRGPKGTKVTLTIKSVDGTIKTIDLIRDKVELEETYLKSAITQKDNRKYGIIKLPGFYFDMEDYEQRNAASDMEKEIKLLKKEKIEGLVIDLRNNGGGSLSTAIDIAGLFVKKGPVVQVRSGNGRKQVLRHQNSQVEWDGPLVILVNELSASASEILAAAMQDYGRAVIMGSHQTYGKGTVQKFLDLNRFMKNDKLGDMGSVKITTQKFYRINGGSTQLKGVTSDVVIPDRYSYIDVGERDLKVPLEWDEIERAGYQKWNGYQNLAAAIKESQARIDSSSQFSLIDENAHWAKSQRDKKDFPLSWSEYEKLMGANEEKAEYFKKIKDYETTLEFSSTLDELKKIEKDSSLEKKRDRWHKNLQKDIYIEEALEVLKTLKLSDAQQQKMAEVLE